MAMLRGSSSPKNADRSGVAPPEHLIISGTNVGRYLAQIPNMGKNGARAEIWYMFRRRQSGKLHFAEITARENQVRAWFGRRVYR